MKSLIFLVSTHSLLGRTTVLLKSLCEGNYNQLKKIRAAGNFWLRSVILGSDESNELIRRFMIPGIAECKKRGTPRNLRDPVLLT